MTSKESKKPASENKPATYVYKPTDDSYKFVSWCVRKLIQMTTGTKFGDSKFDENVGTAVASVYPAEAFCNDELTKICIHAAAGAWKGVK